MMKGFISCNYLQGIVIVRVGKDGGLPHGGSVLFRVGAAIQNGDDGGCRGARACHGFLAFCCVLLQ